MTELLWKSLLNLRQALCESKESVDFVAIDPEGNASLNQSSPAAKIVVSIAATPPTVSNNQSLFLLKDKIHVDCQQPGSLSREEQDFLIDYLPYCFLPLLAKQKKRAISVAHFAQTLDGKIATPTGESKWIGNQENLIHAHRMRALCCSILVGKNTVLEDKPSLTVRHVQGKNPKRVVISSSPCDMSSLLCEDAEKVLVFGKTDQPDVTGLDYNKLASQNGHINCTTILEALFQKGIYTVYIEGGAITTSNFLNDRAVDILQLHLAPMLFGSGQSAIQLPAIDKVNGAVQFNRFRYQSVGDAIMFVGELNTKR